MRLREVTASSHASDSDSAWIGVWLSHYPSAVPWSASPSSLSSRFWESFTAKLSFCVKSTFSGQSQKVKKKSLPMGPAWPEVSTTPTVPLSGTEKLLTALGRGLQ